MPYIYTTHLIYHVQIIYTTILYPHTTHIYHIHQHIYTLPLQGYMQHTLLQGRKDTGRKKPYKKRKRGSKQTRALCHV